MLKTKGPTFLIPIKKEVQALTHMDWINIAFPMKV